MYTTEPNDGSIESAIAGLLRPEEPVETEEVLEAEEAEEIESEEEVYEEEEDDEEVVEEDDDDADEAEDSEPDLYTVKVDGKEERVSLEELKRGFSGQKYVQKGMQEAAAQRKQVEEVYVSLLQEREVLAQERQMVSQAIQQIQSGLPTPPQEPSRNMFESDPFGYMEAKLKFDEDSKLYGEQIGRLQQIAQQQGQAQQAAQRAYLEREMETLKQIVPEFADPEQAPKARDRLLTMGQEVYGYGAEEISAVMDHRAIRVLNDALKYQELMSGKAEKTTKPKNRRVVKAGAKKTSSNSQAQRQTRQKLKQSGSIDDALNLILGN